LFKKTSGTLPNYLKEKIRPAEDPRLFGKPLSGDLNGVWRYRVGDSCM